MVSEGWEVVVLSACTFPWEGACWLEVGVVAEFPSKVGFFSASYCGGGWG